MDSYVFVFLDRNNWDNGRLPISEEFYKIIFFDIYGMAKNAKSWHRSELTAEAIGEIITKFESEAYNYTYLTHKLVNKCALVQVKPPTKHYHFIFDS